MTRIVTMTTGKRQQLTNDRLNEPINDVHLPLERAGERDEAAEAAGEELPTPAIPIASSCDEPTQTLDNKIEPSTSVAPVNVPEPANTLAASPAHLQSVRLTPKQTEAARYLSKYWVEGMRNEAAGAMAVDCCAKAGVRMPSRRSLKPSPKRPMTLMN
jgi:hypothetical protein